MIGLQQIFQVTWRVSSSNVLAVLHLVPKGESNLALQIKFLLNARNFLLYARNFLLNGRNLKYSNSLLGTLAGRTEINHEFGKIRAVLRIE